MFKLCWFWILGRFCLQGCLKLEFWGHLCLRWCKMQPKCITCDFAANEFWDCSLIQSMNQIFCCHWSSWAHQNNNKIKKPKHKFFPALNEGSRVNSGQCSSIILFSLTWWSSFWVSSYCWGIIFSIFLSKLSFCIIMCWFLRTFRLSDN
jgi:hypothetical protein